MAESINVETIRIALQSVFRGDSFDLFVFGSRAAGTARPNSDWDIGVRGREPVPGRVMERARDALESLRTLQSFDLVDFRRVSKTFQDIAVRNTIPLAGDVL